MMAAAPADPDHPERGGVTAAELSDYFVQHGRYTAGVATSYPARSTHLHGRRGAPARRRGLPGGLPVPFRARAPGRRCQGDAVGHAATADGRWRVYAFADAGEQRFDAFVDWLGEDPGSPVNRHRLPGEDLDARIDVRAVLQRPHTEIALPALPEVLRPSSGALSSPTWRRSSPPARIPARTSMRSAGSTRSRARSWSCVPTSTSRPSCRSTRPPTSPRSSTPSSTPRRYLCLPDDDGSRPVPRSTSRATCCDAHSRRMWRRGRGTCRPA